MEQQCIFTKRTSESENSIHASFTVSELIGKNLKPFSDGEFIKQCLVSVVEIVCLEKRDLLTNISLSRMTVTRRIEKISKDLKLSLKQRAEQFEYYSLAHDESTDATDTAQLAVLL